MLSNDIFGNSLLAQWLRHFASNAEGRGSVPGWGTNILHAMWHGQKTKELNDICFPSTFSCSSYNKRMQDV